MDKSSGHNKLKCLKLRTRSVAMSLRNTIKSIKRPDPVKVKYSVFGLLVNTSSIHGVKYIGDLQSTRITRTFWICAFLLSILGCAYYATQVYDKWYVTPDIGLKVQFNSSRTVPFPAITICPQSKIKQEFLNYGNALRAAFNGGSGEFINEESRQYFEAALQLCTTSHINMLNDSFVLNPTLNGNDYVNLISEMQFPINQTILGLKLKSGFYADNFERVLDRVVTSDGFCVTYNMQDYSSLFKEDSGLDEDFDSYKTGRNSSWNPIAGYPNEDTDQYPIRIFSGSKNAVVFLLAQNTHDIDEACLGPDQGYRIFWHMPNEVPSFSHRSIILGHQKSKKLIMKATQIRTSDDLQRYDAKQRRCYFDGDKKLKFFKSYTKSHCDMECLAEYILKKCECVKFYMPRTSATPVCNITSLACAEQAEDDWLENDKSYLANSMPCGCYPSCSQIKYDVISTVDAEFSTNKTLAAFGDTGEFYKDFPTGQISRLSIEFEDFLIEAQENFLGYKMQHFISDCGGLLGLFMGCSILSLVEIFYQIFASFFLQDQNNSVSGEKNEKPPTPMKDNRAVVIVEDDEKEKPEAE